MAYQNLGEMQENPERTEILSQQHVAVEQQHRQLLIGRVWCLAEPQKGIGRLDLHRLPPRNLKQDLGHASIQGRRRQQCCTVYYDPAGGLPPAQNVHHLVPPPLLLHQQQGRTIHGRGLLHTN